jgi:hypothetical protein
MASYYERSDPKLTAPVEAATKTRQQQRGATHEKRPDTTKHRARKGVLLAFWGRFHT